MNQKLFIMLMVGVILGFIVGYFVGREQGAGDTQKTDQMPLGASEGRRSMLGPDTSQQDMMENKRRQIQHILEVLDQDPENIQAMIALGNLNYDINEFQKAVSYYEMALERDPSNLHVRVDQAVSYKYLKEFDKAIEGLTKVLEIDPNHPQALYNMGVIMLHDKNDLKEARDYWTRVLATGTNQMDLTKVKKRLEVVKKMIQQETGEQTDLPE